MKLTRFAFLLILFALPAFAQEAPKHLALTDKSNVPAADITKALQRECPNVSITDDMAKSDFMLEAIKHKGKHWNVIDVTLFDRDGITFRSVTDAEKLNDAVKVICRALKIEVAIEVVNPENLTQSSDARGTGAGLPALAVNAFTGRKTHTDAATMSVIVNDEHALLDCYERRTGCMPLGPGKYYCELDSDKRSLWIEHEVPLTHQPVRDHYLIAGSW